MDTRLGERPTAGKADVRVDRLAGSDGQCQTPFRIKTTVDPKFARTRLLYQVLGYVLLDYDDASAISAVGVYLSRQGLLVRWLLDELLRTLLDGKAASLSDLRASFRDAVRGARAAVVLPRS